VTTHETGPRAQLPDEGEPSVIRTLATILIATCLSIGLASQPAMAGEKDRKDQQEERKDRNEDRQKENEDRKEDRRTEHGDRKEARKKDHDDRKDQRKEGLGDEARDGVRESIRD
jgi:Ni/Co efflux regulator RcnB